MDYTKHVSTRRTPQSQKILGSNQIKNSAGGYSWEVDQWTKLDRFLILGSEGGSYYATERELTVQNADNVLACIKEDGVRVVNRVVEISQAGRAPKNDPAIFVLALATKFGDEITRQAAYASINKVCRIGTHLFTFTKFREAFGGWGRGMRKAVANWYNEKTPDKLAYQIVKYKQRNGWSHRDLLRLSHATPVSDEHDGLFYYAVNNKPYIEDGFKIHPLVEAVEEVKNAKQARKVIRLIEENNLPREVVPTEHLNNPAVWEALLPNMPLTAMIRNLGNMGKVGLLTPMSDTIDLVVDKMLNAEALKKARVHPLQVLVALNTYARGMGVRGSGQWPVVPQVKDALDKAFYLAFDAVEPTNKKTLLALDVSSSMTWGEIAGMPGITPRIGSAAMALVTARTEPKYHVLGFSHELVKIPMTGRETLNSTICMIEDVRMGGTDCARPMIWAKENKVDVDTFVVYTDNETWYGIIHPAQALEEYRQFSGNPARLVVVGMLANKSSIADPNDPGMLDLVGFDTAAPNLISKFSAGEI